MVNKLRPKILLISLGSIGKRHLRNCRELLPEAVLAAYRLTDSELDTSQLGLSFVFSTLEEVDQYDPDIVIISSPASKHIKFVNYFLSRDIPVFVEKPLAATTEDAETSLEIAQASKAFCMVGYVLRFLPTIHFIRKIVQERTYGAVYTASIEVGQYLPNWRPNSDYRNGVSGQRDLGGGCLLELSHEIDYCLFLFGMPTDLFCNSGHFSNLEIDVEDNAQIMLGYDESSPVRHSTISLDFLQKPAQMRIQMVCEHATVVANLLSEEVIVFSDESKLGDSQKNLKTENGNEVYLRQFDFLFAKCVSGYEPIFEESKNFEFYAGIDDGFAVMKIIDLCRQSARSGVRLDLPNAP